MATYYGGLDLLGTPVEGSVNPETVQWSPTYSPIGREQLPTNFSQGQQNLATALQGQAAGTTPSIAQQQLQQGTDANIAQQRALAASGRGTNLGLAQKLAATNAAGAQQQMAGQSAIARLQEQMAAQQLLGQTLNQGQTGAMQAGQLGVAQRGQDIQQQQQQNAQELAWAQTLRNIQPEQGGGGLAAMAGIAGGLGMMFSDKDLKNETASEGTAGDKIGNFLKGSGQIMGAVSGQPSGQENPYNAIGQAVGQAIKHFHSPSGIPEVNQGMANAVTQQINPNFQQPTLGVGQFQGDPSLMDPMAGLMASDEDLKKNIDKTDSKTFLDAIEPYEFEYKNPEIDGSGEHFSPMAQELEKSEVGRSMVENTPRGKMIDYGKGMGVLLASQGYLNDRLDGIEKALKIKRGKKNGK